MTGRGGKEIKYERRPPARPLAHWRWRVLAALSSIFSDREEERSAEETSERANSLELITQTEAPFGSETSVLASWRRSKFSTADPFLGCGGGTASKAQLIR